MSSDLAKLADLAKPQISPVLDEGFRPAVLANRAFRQLVKSRANLFPSSSVWSEAMARPPGSRRPSCRFPTRIPG